MTIALNSPIYSVTHYMSDKAYATIKNLIQYLIPTNCPTKEEPKEVRGNIRELRDKL